jgi:excisionase family DNA binding protein
MNEEQLQELRERVERRKRAAEVSALKNELRGLNNVVDPAVVYLTTAEAAAALDVSKVTLLTLIMNGELPRSMKVRGATRAPRWAIHPEDVEKLKPRFRRIAGYRA